MENSSIEETGRSEIDVVVRLTYFVGKVDSLVKYKRYTSKPGYDLLYSPFYRFVLRATKFARKPRWSTCTSF